MTSVELLARFPDDMSSRACCVCLCRLVKWIEGCVCEDPFLNPELMRANPWVEKGKCVIL